MDQIHRSIERTATQRMLVPETPNPADTRTRSPETSEQPAGVGPAPSAMPPIDAVPRYELIREISRGGQGVVYEALQRSTNRHVAIKIQFTPERDRESAHKRFQREVELIAELRHPSIVTIFDCGTTIDGRLYCVMDFIRGVSLQKYAEQRKLPVRETLRLFAELCEAVQHAHQRGIVHRDLKPQNVLVETDGTPKVLDFGLAKRLTGGGRSMISSIGDMIGTLAYMSPEHTRGSEEIDERSDVYSLGVMLYELLTGDFPYPVALPTPAVSRHIVETDPEPPRKAWLRRHSAESAVSRSAHAACPIESDVETIVLKMLAKDPPRRYANAGEVATDLRRYLAGEAIAARRDSVAYVLRTRGRRAVRRQAALSGVAAVALAIVAAELIVFPVMERWTPLGGAYSHWMMSIAPPPKFERTRIIHLRDNAELKEIEKRGCITGFRYEEPASNRVVWAHLLKRLAVARPRVVALCLALVDGTPYDEAFLGGVRALEAVGCDVVVGLMSWTLGPEDRPTIAPQIAAEVRWGGTSGIFQPDEPWEFHLAAQREESTEALPSQLLTTVAAYRQPNMEFSIAIPADGNVTTIRYWRTDPEYPRDRRWVGPADSLQFSRQKSRKESQPEIGLFTGDLVFGFAIRLPPDAAIQANTSTVLDAINADDAALRERYEGRAVVIGDARSSRPAHKTPDGREYHGSVALAVAVEEALRYILASEITGTTSRISLITLLAVLGALLGSTFSHSRSRRWLAGLAVLVVVASCSLWFAYAQQIVWNPIAPAVSFILALEACAAVRRTSVYD